MPGTLLVLALEPVTAELLRRPLEPLDYALEAVASVEELRRRVLDVRPRAVLVPRRVPGADLPILCAWIAQQGAAPVVIGVGERDRAAALTAGAKAFLGVPFSDSDVLETLGASTRARKLILLADDSPMIHRHTAPLLSDAGYDVVSAVDGEDALAKVRARRPDLVITDVEMPRLDGYGVCKALKGTPETAHLPVIICSALGEAADLERGFDAGADDYLVKPVIPEELTTRVRQLLGGTVPASRETVLVVDDSPAQRHYVEDCLVRQGFVVLTAENGRAGLDKARATSPKLVVSDYDMPIMNGFEMVHALKRDPKLRHIPVVMLTARDTRRDVAQMRAAGAAAYLVKPFAQDKCIATVERTLAERRQAAKVQAQRLYLSDGAIEAADARADAGDLVGETVRAEELTISVLFSDICGFTPMSSRMPPREIILLLNAYFDALCPIVKREGGDIDKFIGDAIMAVFLEGPGLEPPPARAIRAGLAMQEALAEFNRGRERPVEMRVGINTGPLIRGDLGSRFHRRDLTVVGDTVNRANRYESACPRGGVMASASTVEALPGWLEVTEMPGIKLKGVDEPVTGYVVRSIRPREETT